MSRPHPLLWLALPLLLIAACVPPRQVLYPALGLREPALRDFPPGFEVPRSAETGLPMPGFGGDPKRGETRSLYRTPVLFVHGNTVSARFWLPVREQFLAKGWHRDELWAFGYGWDHVHYFDANDLSVPSLERGVASVLAYLSKQRGVPVRQIDIVAHSMGVTLVRQWLKQTNRYHRVRNLVAIAGANDGTWTSSSHPRGPQRSVSWELSPNSPWLAQLNRDGETPGPTRYLTVYDGRGWADVFFPPPLQDSSALEGAVNIAYNREHGTWFDHLDLAREPAPLGPVFAFLSEAGEPLPRATPPRIRRDGERLIAEPAGARLHCADGGREARREGAGKATWPLAQGALLSCFALDPASGLASPLQRHAGAAGYSAAAGALTVEASPPGGVHSQWQRVELRASDPAAFIAYTTSGTPVVRGSPRYDPAHPVVVTSPLRLQAVAYAPDGRQSEPLVLDFDISLEKEEAMTTLQRQLDPDAPEQYEGRRKKGR